MQKSVAISGETDRAIRWQRATLLLYALTIPFPAMVAFSSSFRLGVYNYRPYFIVIMVAMFYVYNLSFEERRAVAVKKHSVLGDVRLLSLMFPIYYALSSFIKGDISIPVVGLYCCWALFAFWLAPILIQTVEDAQKLLRGFLVINCILLIGSILYTTLFAPHFISPTLENRISYGITNPNFFAQIAQVIFISLIGLRVLKPEKKSAWQEIVRQAFFIGCITGIFVLVWYARSRNVQVFMLVSGVTYVILVGKTRRKLTTLLSSNIFIILSVAILTGFFSYQSINGLSSDRVNWWMSLVKALLSTPNPVRSVFFGPTNALSIGGTPNRYDTLADDKLFNKLHVDNFYLEQILEAGIFGLILFVLPYIVILVRSRHFLNGKSAEGRFYCWTVSILIALFYQGIFISIIPTFNNPIGFFFVLFGIAPLSLIRIRPSGKEIDTNSKL